jgi:hypothetical protein
MGRGEQGAAAAAVEPEGFRAEVLDTARNFKASWVELARHLVRVKRDGLFEEWGYATFEAYCARELRIKKTTAQKLVESFGFLEKHEPEAVRAVADPEGRRPPALEVIEVLAAAEAAGRLDEEAYREVREKLWERPVDPAQVRRELAKRFPAPEREEPPAELALRRLAAAARKLARELSGSGRVPRAVAERASALAEDVEKLIG